MDFSQLYDPALDEYVPEALDFLSQFSFDSMVNGLSTPEGLAKARYLDSLFMAARWRAEGNPAELAIFPASPHGFTAFPTKMTRAAIKRTDA